MQTINCAKSVRPGFMGGTFSPFLGRAQTPVQIDTN